MDVPAVQAYQWLVWVIGVSVFALAIGLVIAAVWRASKRPPELHSAAERLQRDAALAPDVAARLRALNQQKDNGQISEADYELRRAEILAGR